MNDFENCLKKVYFKKLKNLRDLTIDFTPNNVTGIFGENGSGKSTIIHALSAVFQPIKKNPTDNRIFEEYKFSDFFKSTSIYDWKDCSFKITYMVKSSNVFEEKEKEFSKTSRWKPKYTTRPRRCVFFIGINTCVPEVETETSTSRINFNKDYSMTSKEKICNIMSEIFNRKYIETSGYRTSRKTYTAITQENIGEYSSLSMGAGEQRTFKILKTLLDAPKESLLIIDEIDLTLHTRALNKLLDHIVKISNEKNLQVIFTSHREEILKRKDINIRNILQLENNTLCFSDCPSECLYKLTGKYDKKIHIFVEDSFSKEIISKLTESLNIRKYCLITMFGAIENAFTIAATKVIEQDDLESTIIVTDGDKYLTEDEKRKQLKKHLSGTESGHKEKINKAIKLLFQYDLEENSNPEYYIYTILKELDNECDIVSKSKEIAVKIDKHNYINDIIREIYGDNCCEIYYGRVMDLVSTTPRWDDLVKNVKKILSEKKKAFKLQ